MGPFADNGDDVDETCAPTRGYAQKRFLLETVFDAVGEVDTFPLLPFVLGEPVRLAMPEGAGQSNVKSAARGLLYTSAIEGRWVLLTFNPDTGALVEELVLEEFSDGDEAHHYWEILPTTGERVLFVRIHFSVEGMKESLWELGQDDTLTDLGALDPTDPVSTGAVVEPRGLWTYSDDSALIDPLTDSALGTASSLLGVRGRVLGVAGESLVLRDGDGATVVVRPDGEVQLTIPRLLDQGLIGEPVTAAHDGLLLHSMFLPAKEDVVLVGRDEHDVVSTLATGCGETLPPESGISMVFEVGGAPYLLVSDVGLGTRSVYPILPMP